MFSLLQHMALGLALSSSLWACPPETLARLADRPAQETDFDGSENRAGKFIPIAELAAEYAPFIDRAYQITRSHPSKTPENTPERILEEEAVFRTALQEVLGDRQFRVIDTPQTWMVSRGGQRVPLPIHLARVLTFDHHGPFLNFGRNDPNNNEKRNSSKQMLDYIAAEVQGLKGEALDRRIQELQGQFDRVSTDNLGDGALGIWIARHLDRVARDPKLRAELAQMTFYEDYGYFGTKTDTIVQQTGNPDLKQAVERTKALFEAYDQILKEARQRNPAPELGTNGSDRIGQLSRDEQNRIIESAVQAVDRVLSTRPADQLAVREAAARFDIAINEAKQTLNEKSEKLKNDVAAHLLKTEPGRSRLATAARLDDFLAEVFITYGLDPNAPTGGGRFATWGALPRSHPHSSQVEISPRADGRTNFIFAHPQGRAFEPWFKKAADEIKAKHLQRLQASGASAEELAKANWDVVGRPGPSDFYFSFTGVKLAPVEIVEILMKHAKDAKLPPGMDALRETVAPNYRANDEAASARSLSEDPEHFRGPRLYTDHGEKHPAHVEDRVDPQLAALNSLDKLDSASEQPRRKFRSALAHVLVPLHDLGMSKPENRSIHPQLATQFALAPKFDTIFEKVWNGGNNPLAVRLRSAFPETEVQSVMRSLLAMSNAHSKSTVPREVLDEGGAAKLYEIMVRAASSSPAKLLLENKISKSKEKPGEQAKTQALEAELAELVASGKGANPLLSKAAAEKRFGWLRTVEDSDEGKKLWLDIRRSLQALSVADAARPTGDATRTSGGHPIIALNNRAGAVILIDPKDGGPLVPYYSTDKLHSGEPNVRTSGFDKDGNFHVTIVDGRFGSDKAHDWHLEASTKVVVALAGDGMILGPQQKLVLEAPVEGPEFAKQIVDRLRATNQSELANRIVIVDPSPEIIENFARRRLDIRIENERFAKAQPANGALSKEEIALLPPAIQKNQDLLRQMRVTTVAEGEELLTAGSYGDQVLILLDGGLRGQPVAAYDEFPVKPGGMVGEGGAVGIGTRTATITASEPSRILIIDGETYRNSVFKPLSAEEAAAELRRRLPSAAR